MNNLSYKKSFIISLIIHLSFLGYLILDFDFSSNNFALNKTQQDKQTIQATVINADQVQQAVAQLKQQQSQKKAAAAKQLAALQQQAAQLKQQNVQAKLQLAKLKAVKQQQQQAQQQLQQIQKQALIAQQQLKDQQAKLKQQQKIKKQQQQQNQKIAQDAKDLLKQQLAADQQQLQSSKNQYVDSVIAKYKAMIISAISQRWLIPPGITQQMHCMLQIQLAPGGAVLNVSLAKTSGNAAFDQSAITAVYRASPLPVPPQTDLFDYFRVINLDVKPENIIS